MLEKLIQNNILMLLLVVIGTIGIISSVLVKIVSAHMLKEAENVHQSNHRLMKLIKAKYEHANLRGDRVTNIAVFVDKYLYEHRVLGIKYYKWITMQKKNLWMILALSVTGAGIVFWRQGFNQNVGKYLIAGVIFTGVLILLQAGNDEKKKAEIIRTYLVDYLANFCAYRYEKIEPREEEIKEPDLTEVKLVMEEEEKEEIKTNEIRIREILEEFLT